jgi:radical SAM superfamily enzyme YgiQ (UPF0313 family)
LKRILLVNPNDPNSLIGFSGVADDSDTKPMMPNLALLTLAAMVPDGIELTIADEQLEPLDFERRWDLVGITGYANHRDRMRVIATEFRSRGNLVAMGGPFVTMSPDEMRDYADILFMGEAERTWPAFLDDFKHGVWKTEYRQTDRIDIAESPMPAFERADRDRYLIGLVQASRGCPFRCDFCDVIIYLGRDQRHKTPARIVDELERLYQLGYREAFVADDNFTSYRKRAKGIVDAMAEWNAAKPSKFRWLTQISIDVAKDPELLARCADAGMMQAFIGIETPNEESLRLASKKQNVNTNLVEDIQSIYRVGIGVQAGMIVGFDGDHLDVFNRQFDFLTEAGVPTITLNLLNAPPGTPLFKRLKDEGRLRFPGKGQYKDFQAGVIPKHMSCEELEAGARWLANKLYDPENFLTRLATLAAYLPDAPEGETGMDRVEAKRGFVLWNGIMQAHRRLGPEFKGFVVRAMQIFKGKNKALLPTIMLQYKHVVANLQRRGVWNPELARLAAPPF